jgi:hypothetical protein
MVEIMISLAECDQGDDKVVAGRLDALIWLVTDPVCERVDAERPLLDEARPEQAAVDQTPAPIVPLYPSDESGHYVRHDQKQLPVVLGLPTHHLVMFQVLNADPSNSVRVLVEDNPSNVRIEQTLRDTIGVTICVHVAMMGTMLPAPDLDGPLSCSSTK